GDVPERATALAAWKAEAERLAGELDALKKADAAAEAQLNSAHAAFAKASAAREAADKARADAKKASDEASATMATALKELPRKEKALNVLIAARDKARIAAEQLANDKELAQAAATFKTKVEATETAIAELRKVVIQWTANVQAETLKIASSQQALDKAVAEV